MILVQKLLNYVVYIYKAKKASKKKKNSTNKKLQTSRIRLPPTVTVKYRRQF